MAAEVSACWWRLRILLGIDRDSTRLTARGVIMVVSEIIMVASEIREAATITRRCRTNQFATRSPRSGLTA